MINKKKKSREGEDGACWGRNKRERRERERVSESGGGIYRGEDGEFDGGRYVAVQVGTLHLRRQGPWLFRIYSLNNNIFSIRS